MKTAREIFKQAYEDRSGKEADDTVMHHMQYCIDAMELYSDQFKPKWVSVSERLPEIDESDEWRNKQSHSKVVPVIESGILNLGWYNHQFEGWQVNGRIGNIHVTKWFDLPLPTKP